ncbi:MAG: peptidyl-prolyl cis-trans isomerase [Alphaproteobacteria bacterium]
MNVSISNDLVKKIIYSQAEFMDTNGNFSLDKLRRLLNASGWTEQRYIDTLRKDIEKQHLVQNPVENINIPAFMNKYLAQLENQKKVFKYIEIRPESLKVDRQISQEELEQYYQDFAAQFEEPETRNVSFIELSVDKLASKVTPSETDIKNYYNENINQFVIPENRNVLQMVFDNQDDADKAFAALNAGGDFYNVAKQFAKQDKAATQLGEVSKDMLIADMSDAVFDLKAGDYTNPIKSELGWHIMKVTNIIPKKETSLAAARNKIIDAIRKEKAYDEAYNAVAEIEDKIGAGATLESIAEEYNARINKVIGLNEEGKSKSAPASHNKLIASTDFIDAAFSYNSGEISQVLEGDNGFTIVRVDSITDAHPKELSEVEGEIQKMWAANEKNAIAQEIINDVTHDLENGDEIGDVGRRFELPVKTTKAIKHTENFAGLSRIQIEELFQEKLGTPKLISNDEVNLIVVPTKVIKASDNLSKEELEVCAQRLRPI